MLPKKKRKTDFGINYNERALDFFHTIVNILEVIVNYQYWETQPVFDYLNMYHICAKSLKKVYIIFKVDHLWKLNLVSVYIRYIPVDFLK